MFNLYLEEQLLRINISETSFTQRFDAAITSFSSDKIKYMQCEVIYRINIVTIKMMSQWHRNVV